MSKQEELRSQMEERKKQSEFSRKTALMILCMGGVNIITPEEVGEPIIREVIKDKNSEDAFTDMIITMEKLSPSKRKDVLKAVAVKYLEQADLLNLGQELQDLTSEVLTYSMDHPEVRKSKEEAFTDFMECIKEDGEDPMGII